jgi:hypothetical protein
LRLAPSGEKRNPLAESDETDHSVDPKGLADTPRARDESAAIAQVVDPIAGPSCTQIVRGKTWRDISLAKLSQKYLDHLDRA